MLFKLSVFLLELAHKPKVIGTPWHDRLEKIAYKLQDLAIRLRLR